MINLKRKIFITIIIILISIGISFITFFNIYKDVSTSLKKDYNKRKLIKEKIDNFQIKLNQDIEDIKKQKILYGKWSIVKDEMSIPRGYVTANLMPDGNVLIMGSQNKQVNTVDIYDTKKQKIIKTIAINDNRVYSFSATTLKNGNILVAGGRVCPFDSMAGKLTNTSKIFDHNKYEFYDVGNLNYFTGSHKAIPLKNGKVLILHGYEINTNENCCTIGTTYRFDIFNPKTNTYELTENTIKIGGDVDYFEFVNGDLLIFANDNERYIYNIKENKFESTNNIYPKTGLYTQLDDFNYLILESGVNQNKGYVYNIETKQKTPISNDINKSWRFNLFSKTLLLNSGDVFIYGIYESQNKEDYWYSAYIYSKQDNNLYKIPLPKTPVSNASILELDNGNIMLAGGFHNDKKQSIIQIYKY